MAGVSGVVAVVSAIPQELRAIERCTRDSVRSGPRRRAGSRYGTIAEREVLLAHVGVGNDRAWAETRNLIAEHSVRWLLAVGFAGGLSSTARSGDLVVAKDVVDLKGTEETGEPVLVCPDPGLWMRACQLRPGDFRIHPGRILCHYRLVPRSDEKRALGESWTADAVDMESAGIGRAVAEAGIPVLFARAVLDEAELDLHPAAGSIVSPDGRVRWPRLLRRLASSPSAARGLWDLGLRSRRAAKNLAWFVSNVLRTCPET